MSIVTLFLPHDLTPRATHVGSGGETAWLDEVTSVLGLYTHSLPVTDMGTEINSCYS